METILHIISTELRREASEESEDPMKESTLKSAARTTKDENHEIRHSPPGPGQVQSV